MRKLDKPTPDSFDVNLARKNPDRYSQIMTKGWYLFTWEGVKGPFYDKSYAALFLQQYISQPAEIQGPG